MELKPYTSKYTAEHGHINVDEKIASLFEPDTLLSAQYFENFRRKISLEPEKRLMLAVLQDAVNCFQDNILAQSGTKRRLFEEAQEWIFEENNDWIFSFANICEVFGLHPQYVRQGLLRWKRETLLERTRAKVSEVREMAG